MQKLSPDSREVQNKESAVIRDGKSRQSARRWRNVLIVVSTGVFLMSLALSIWVLRPSDKRLVEVVSDGEVLYTFDLSDKENIEFTVYYGGSSNTIRVENGEIWVREAECPDKTCVKMGKLHWESLPIVCLPNRLTIRFAE